jgi:hypothetical protein
MIEKKYIELINQEIDGVNTPQDSAKLKAYLAANPKAKSLYNDLRAASEMLNAVKEIDSPSHLKANILNAIPADKYAAREKRAPQSKPNLLENLFGFLQPRPAARYAFAFSLGLFAGVLIYAALVENVHKNSMPTNSDLYGTIALREAPGSFDAGDIVEMNPYGTINLKYSKDLVVAELNLQTQQEVELVFEYDPSALKFGAFSIRNQAASNTVKTSENSLRLTSFGENKYAVLFTKRIDAPAPLRLKIYSADGALLHEQIIALTQSNK